MLNEVSRTIRGQRRSLLHAYHADSPTSLAVFIIGAAAFATMAN